MVKKIIDNFKDSWRSILLGILLISGFSGFYFFKLGAFIRGDTIYESHEFLGINGKEAILQDIAFAPHKMLELIMVKIDDPNATLLRLISVGIIFIATVALFLLLKKWHTVRVAVLATILFATSSYSLHLGRFSHTETMMYAVVPILLLAGTWLKSKKTVSRLPIAMSMAGLMLYIPGMLLFLGTLAIIFKKRLLLAWRFVQPKQRWIGLLSFIAIVSPLLYGLYVNSSQFTRLLGFDQLFEEGHKSFISSVSEIPSSLVFNGYDEPYRWLTGTPILDLASAVLLLFGIYSYVRGYHPLRARLLGGIIVFSVLLAGTSSFNAMALLIPAIYLVIANGIAFLLQTWFTVFPKNPAARSVGVIVLVIVCGFIVNYHTQRYFEAWPIAPSTTRSLEPQAQIE